MNDVYRRGGGTDGPGQQWSFFSSNLFLTITGTTIVIVVIDGEEQNRKRKKKGHVRSSVCVYVCYVTFTYVTGPRTKCWRRVLLLSERILFFPLSIYFQYLEVAIPPNPPS